MCGPLETPRSIAHGSQSAVEGVEIYKTLRYLANLDGTRPMWMLELDWKLERLGRALL
jgi:hypothetical protein